jgi:hypothetical protein
LVGSIYGRSSIKIAHFVPIRKQTWPLQAILVSEELISKKSSPLKPASRQLSVHLAKQFQRRFLEINQPETRIAYSSHVC